MFLGVTDVIYTKLITATRVICKKIEKINSYIKKLNGLYQ